LTALKRAVVRALSRKLGQRRINKLIPFKLLLNTAGQVIGHLAEDTGAMQKVSITDKGFELLKER